ncbi:spoIID/LytB domain protein [Rubidibacter lacunae KORDI 51-2]|uniref:SpoIID/LytB domain protein n=1 Tax=Rubidibacter lacunae KORDI 51-2 TaxID=582515 RepID=U5DJN1_9CHRO|nr:SpoIID/LytB domain-containing protein [Rubidibacter lacunae]ERN41097.1 spoIID/LytB domain protein [Rubidibacter lacunae KORDI 51-2]
MGISRTLGLMLAVASALVIAPSAVAERLLKVGIVQRFGEADTDVLELVAPNGSLSLTFEQGGEAVSLQVNTAVLELAAQPLPEPQLFERLVLGDYATFETAEAGAREWEARGIDVEVAQPGRWQVWAQRDVYSTPLVRRQLLKNLRDRGYDLPFMISEVQQSVPQVVLAVGADRYLPEQLTVTGAGDRVRVRANAEDAYTYVGSLHLQPDAYGSFALVNRVSLEDYLRGVVPYEIAPGAPAAAIAAQAIVARTYAMRNLRRFAADDYELCATVHCQVYRGVRVARGQTDRAIASTSNLVLTYDSELVDALYSSTTGGITAPFSDIWDGDPRPYLRAVIDAPGQVWDLQQLPLSDEQTFRKFLSLQQGFNESGTSAFRWRRQSSLDELAGDLRRYLDRSGHPKANFARLKTLEIVERSPSGRILQLDALTDLGIAALRKNEVRSAFGPPRSTLFYLEPLTDSSGALSGYTFVGGGFGHGAGLSQYGSYNLARLGWSPERILAFYYPGTKIRPLDESVVLYGGD